MNKLYKGLCIAIAALSMLSSCEKGGPDDLEGIYNPPVEITTSEALGTAPAESHEISGLKVFNVVLPTQEGTLSIDFLGAKYYLAPEYYTAATPENASSVNFLASSSYFEKDGRRFAVTKGSVTVAKNEDNYSFDGVVWVDDGRVLKIKGSGNIHYERKATQLTGCFDCYTTKEGDYYLGCSV